MKQLEDTNEGGRSGWAYGLARATQSVGQHPARIRTAQQLKAIHGIGDFTTKVGKVRAQFKVGFSIWTVTAAYIP